MPFVVSANSRIMDYNFGISTQFSSIYLNWKKENIFSEWVNAVEILV